MSQHTRSDDAALMERIAAGDHAGLADLYDRFGAKVYTIAYHVLRNRTLAEEATQDTFMKVWTHVTRWSPERGTLEAWLLTVARYTAIDRLRKEKNSAPWTAIGLDELLEIIGTHNVVDDQFWYDAQRVEALLSRLSPEQREAINLAFFSGMSHNAIASKLNLPLGTVKTRIRDGLQLLKGLWLHDRD